MASAAYLTADATVSGHKATVINTASDTDLRQPTRGIYIGGGGTIVVDMADGSTAIPFVGAMGGIVLPIQATKIYSLANGTTATSIVALF